MEEESRTYGVNRRGFPVIQYQYKVSGTGAERVERLRGKYPEEVEQIEHLVRKLLEVVGSLDQATLSAAAKTFYIAREQENAVTPEDIAGLARDYGWELSADRVSAVAAILHDLQFVKVN